MMAFTTPRTNSYMNRNRTSSTATSKQRDSIARHSMRSTPPQQTNNARSPTELNMTVSPLQDEQENDGMPSILATSQRFLVSIISPNRKQSAIENNGYSGKAPYPTIESDSDSEQEKFFNSRINHASNISNLTTPTASPQAPVEPDTPSTIKIVAPNVMKLSRSSVIDVKLNSINECVVVTCSMDVLKMRSGFFCDILCEREENYNLAKSKDREVLREPICIPEISPFEAAAYLESLHEGRALFKGEWNMSWARLSVMWFIEDHQIEYAAQIEAHVNKLLQYIKENHWRTNSNVLSGCKIAIFRKGSGPAPTMISGFIIESPTSTVYSRVRVLFDNNKTNSLGLNIPQSPTPIGVKFDRTRDPFPMSPKGSTNKDSMPSTPRGSEVSEVVGDVELPFWVQREGGNWSDPDDLFNQIANSAITLTDKRIFWEMIRIVIEFPELTRYMSSPYAIKNTKDLAKVLKRPENRVLWVGDAAEYIPKDAACELLLSAYAPSKDQSEQLHSF